MSEVEFTRKAKKKPTHHCSNCNCDRYKPCGCMKKIKK